MVGLAQPDPLPAGLLLASVALTSGGTRVRRSARSVREVALEPTSVMSATRLPRSKPPTPSPSVRMIGRAGREGKCPGSPYAVASGRRHTGRSGTREAQQPQRQWVARGGSTRAVRAQSLEHAPRRSHPIRRFDSSEAKVFRRLSRRLSWGVPCRKMDRARRRRPAMSATRTRTSASKGVRLGHPNVTAALRRRGRRSTRRWRAMPTATPPAWPRSSRMSVLPAPKASAPSRRNGMPTASSRVGAAGGRHRMSGTCWRGSTGFAPQARTATGSAVNRVSRAGGSSTWLSASSTPPAS